MSVEVVVTGLGAVSPIGEGAQLTFDAALQGRSGITKTTEPKYNNVPVKLLAPINTPLVLLHEKEIHKWDRSTALAMQATREAWNQAAITTLDPERLAVSVSAGWGSLMSTQATMSQYLQRGPRSVHANLVPRTMPNSTAAQVAIEIGARAGTYSMVSACSSGADAIAQAYRLIRSGEADVVVTGGTEAALSPIVVAGFAAMRALAPDSDAPETTSRPFDRTRSGFVLGEGAATVVLESAQHAEARNAKIIARLGGVGITSDAHGIVAPDPAGTQAVRAMRRALGAANVATQDLTAISAHATATQLGDAAESEAISQLLGNQTVPVTALKGSIGHLIGASGPMALAMACLSLQVRVLTPTINFMQQDEAHSLDIVGPIARDLPPRSDASILVNTFGFGGHNVCLCVTSR